MEVAEEDYDFVSKGFIVVHDNAANFFQTGHSGTIGHWSFVPCNSGSFVDEISLR